MRCGSDNCADQRGGLMNPIRPMIGEIAVVIVLPSCSWSIASPHSGDRNRQRRLFARRENYAIQIENIAVAHIQRSGQSCMRQCKSENALTQDQVQSFLSVAVHEIDGVVKAAVAPCPDERRIIWGEDQNGWRRCGRTLCSALR